MAVIKWRESYETGVEEMDREHQALVAIINQLFEMQRDKKAFSELRDVYQKLIEYTEKHFQHEEQLLEKSGYPELENQKRFHRHFVTKMETMKDDLIEGKEEAAPVVYRYLREWLLGHIVEEDMKYGNHLQKKQEKE